VVVVGGKVVVGGSVVVVGSTVVVVVSQSHETELSTPTVYCRQIKASEAVIPPERVVSQIQGTSQVSVSTAARRMNKQSRAIALAPVLNGCEQSLRSARAGVAAPGRNVVRSSRPKTQDRAADDTLITVPPHHP
jgi:hypothetical protein